MREVYFRGGAVFDLQDRFLARAKQLGGGVFTLIANFLQLGKVIELFFFTNC